MNHTDAIVNASRNSLQAEVILRHGSRAKPYPAALEAGVLRLCVPDGAKGHRWHDVPRSSADAWRMARGTDADLAAIRAAGYPIGDLRQAEAEKEAAR